MANNDKVDMMTLPTYVGDRRPIIVPEEVDFIDKDGDLIPVVARMKTPLRRFMDRFDIVGEFRFFRRNNLKSSHYNHPDNYESNTTIYSNESLINKVVTCITIALGLGMLLGPLWVLQHVSNDPSSGSSLQIRLTIITVFVAAFTIFMSILTNAHTFEVLAATAAYSAVLMVFMQLNSFSGGGGGGGGSSGNNFTSSRVF